MEGLRWWQVALNVTWGGAFGYFLAGPGPVGIPLLILIILFFHAWQLISKSVHHWTKAWGSQGPTLMDYSLVPGHKLARFLGVNERLMMGSVIPVIAGRAAYGTVLSEGI